MEKMTLLNRLAQLYPQAKKNTLREMVEDKRVRLNGTLVRSLKQPVTEKDALEVLDAAANTKTMQLAERLRLVHFDRDIAIVDKPAGLLTATDSDEKRPTAWAILSEYFRRPNSKNRVHLVHRLDRDASGLLVFARTWPALTSLKKQFFEHTINRQYDVLVHGIPKKSKARLENLLIEDPQTGRVRVTSDIKAGKLAIFDYEVISTNAVERLSHLRCTLLTGKKHQLRVQLQSIGHAVCSDPFYGKVDEPPHRLALHACHLTFEHPGNHRPTSFESPMPKSFSQLFPK